MNATILIRPYLYRGITYTDHTEENGIAHTTVPGGRLPDRRFKRWLSEFFRRFQLTEDVTFKTELWVGTDVHDLFGYPLRKPSLAQELQCSRKPMRTPEQ